MNGMKLTRRKFIVGTSAIGAGLSLGILPRPVDGMDIDAKRVGPQALRIAWWLDHDGQDGGPAFGGGELTVLVAPLNPGDAEARVRGADDA